MLQTAILTYLQARSLISKHTPGTEVALTADAKAMEALETVTHLTPPLPTNPPRPCYSDSTPSVTSTCFAFYPPLPRRNMELRRDCVPATKSRCADHEHDDDDDEHDTKEVTLPSWRAFAHMLSCFPVIVQHTGTVWWNCGRPCTIIQWHKPNGPCNRRTRSMPNMWNAFRRI